MSNEDLIAEARRHVGPFALPRPDFSAASVASALVTGAGDVYTGVCFDVACGIGSCAEHAAVAAMLQGRETAVAKWSPRAGGAGSSSCRWTRATSRARWSWGPAGP